MAISKKLRFEVFKRDSFTCCYCGSCPPGIVLEVDHIVAVSKGGSDEIDNLITSCFNCNRGKSNRDLFSLPLTVNEKLKIAQEKESQYSAYQKYLAGIEKRVEREIDCIEKLYCAYFPDYRFTDHFRLSVKKFLKELGLHEVKEAMEKSLGRLDGYSTLKYFCGICWSKIRER